MKPACNKCGPTMVQNDLAKNRRPFCAFLSNLPFNTESQSANIKINTNGFVTESPPFCRQIYSWRSRDPSFSVPRIPGALLRTEFPIGNACRFSVYSSLTTRRATMPPESMNAKYDATYMDIILALKYGSNHIFLIVVQP